MTDNARPFRECDTATDDVPLRQGDVFEWLAQDGDDPLRKIGLIVTADCDIAHDKHQGIISYVPILSLSDYLRLFELPRRVKRQWAKVDEDLVAAIRRCQTALPEFPEPLSEETIRDWVSRETDADILKALGVAEPKVLARISDLILDHRTLGESLGLGTAEAQIDALAGRLARTSKRGLDAARDQVTADLALLVDNLPGDAFFVGVITDGSPPGHVAYLRLVREIQHREIAIRPSELAVARAKRISRMTSPYLYRLTQQLAAVFAAIGLPVEYEVERRRIGRAVTAFGRGQAGKVIEDD